MRRLQRLARRSTTGASWSVLAGAVGVLLVLAALLAIIVYLPPQAIAHANSLGEADWLKAVQDLRTTILQGLGGVALLGTLYFSARTLRLNRRGQLTDRFTKAIEQLGSDKLTVRLGGIYALEQIALDSRELHWSVIEVLTAYLHEHARVDPTPDVEADKKRLPVDHQAIATVIGRRRWRQDPEDKRLELAELNLPGVLWRRAHLRRANLWRANLEGAYLRFAHLERARLVETNLTDAHLGSC
jgi:Pentapeptide repeats (8 copies)